MAETAVDKPKHRNQYPPAVTKAKQHTFLDILASTGSHGKSCKAALCDESAPIRWAHGNAKFAKAWDVAKQAGEKALLLRYETDLDEVLLPDDGRLDLDNYARLQNSRFFRMKRLDPAYRDNAVVQVNAIGPTAIQLNFGQAASTQLTQADTQAEADN